MSIYSNNVGSTYSRLDDPYQLLEFSNSNCCRMSPYLKCTHCFSKCDKCCKGILQGAHAKFDYNLPGVNCGCQGIPNAIQSCAPSDAALGCSSMGENSGIKSCGAASGLRCKYY